MRRQKGGTVDFFFEVSTFMFRVLYGIVFSPSRFFWKNAREDFKIRDTKRTPSYTKTTLSINTNAN